MSERVFLTDQEWEEFQSLPEQGYSHRAWVDYVIADRVGQVLAQLEELCDERDDWLLEDRPKPWPPGTVYDALVSVTELRNFIASIREEDG